MPARQLQSRLPPHPAAPKPTNEHATLTSHPPKSHTPPACPQAYTYLAFPSETITRSGYQVRRRHVAVAATRRGSVYVLGCSARSDQYDAAKERLFQHVVDSFRLL